jgi:hypothetical protein
VHVVVNHLTVSGPPADAVIGDLQRNALSAAAAIDGIVDVHLAKVDDTHLIMLIVGDSPAALERLSSEVGSPWVQANLGPLFTAPPNRSVGEVLASTRFL